MTKYFLGGFCLLALTCSMTSVKAQSTFPEEGIKNPQPLYTLLKGAIVHHPNGLVEQGEVLVYEGKIKAYGQIETSELQENTRVVHLDGLHLYPGFIDLKSNYGMPAVKKQSSEEPVYERAFNHATYWNDAIHPERNAIAQFEPAPKEAEKLRSLGVAAALVLAPDGVARGRSAVVLTGDEEANKLTLLSAAAAHFSFEKGSSKQDYPSSLMGCVALLRQALYDAQWHAGATPAEANYSLEALAAQLQGPLFFEGRDKYDLHRLGLLAEEFELDFIAYEPGYAYENVASISPRIKGLVVPLKLPKPFDTDDPDLMRFIDQEEMLHWERAPYNALSLRDAGIPFAFTTSGLESTDELFSTLRKLRSKGIPENLILESLTSIPASFLGMEHQIGQIAAGYEAHFFITSGDIFIDEKAELRTHYIRGKAYQVKAAPAVLLPGKYDLNVDNLYLELQVGGKHPEYEAQVQTISGSDTTTWKATLSLLGHELSLAFMAPDSSGTYRLSASARSENRIWDGMGKNPEGLDIEWSGIRKVEKSPSPKNGNESKTKNGIGKSPAKSTPTDAISISAPTFPAMRYPMCAYGFDSIPDTETLLISNATVWTNTSEGKLKNAQVLMHNGKILALGQNLNPEEWLPKKTIESLVHLDATGMHLTPGIVDEHSHIAISRGVNEGTQAVTSEVRIADALNPSDINIFRQLSGGVTTSQLLHGSANPIGGQSAVIKLRWGQPYSAMVFAEAPQFIKFALGENVKQTNWGDKYTSRYPQTRMGVEQIFYDYFYRAKNYSEKLTLYQAAMEAQNEGRKKRKASPTPVFRRDLELEALLEILNGTRHITCHSYVQSEINMLMHVADSMGFKVNTFTHILEGYKIADKLAAHGAAGSSFSDWWAYKYEVRDAIPYNGTLMHNAGVLVGFNSDDAEMARRLNQEAAKAIKYGGMSEENALKLVTLNPAKMMHIDHLVGSIAPGMHADLVLWNGHPLSVYSSAQVTFVDGIRYFDRSRLEDLMRRDQADRARIADLMRAAKAGGEESQKPERKMERYYHCTDIEEQ